tara:strand:+ start:8305 stop:9579 length:1275 start_codon:yes stop_codon:yes gene_type:complete
MASATATSKIAPVVIGSGRGKSTTYIATKVSGPDTNGDFTSEIVQYDNASGGGAKTIGNRDADGNITWNSDASNKIKLNQNKFKKASNNQIGSVQDQLTTTAVDKQGLNAAAGKSNQDNTDGNTDSSQSKPTPTPRDEGGGLSGNDKGSKIPRNSYSKTLCYPVAMRKSLQDNLKIDVVEFNPKTMKGGTTLDRPKGKTIGSVTLPVPTSVQDGNQTSWGSGSMTAVQMAAANVVKAGLGENGGEAAAAELTSAMNDAQKDQMTGEALKNFFTEQLTGTTDLLSRTTGAVLNPNMELLFKGPALRSFTFSWKMSPRDQKESIEIAKIIRMFKQSMAPQKSDSGLFLKAPSIYKLTFNKGTGRHKFLPRMKECALNNCAVNYTPDGSYMTYDNSAMVALEMSLSFQEMEPIYNNDMSHSDDSIGY